MCSVSPPPERFYPATPGTVASNPFGFCSDNFSGIPLWGIPEKWPARRDLNPCSPESESVALSSCATGGYVGRGAPDFLLRQYRIIQTCGVALNTIIHHLPKLRKQYFVAAL